MLMRNQVPVTALYMATRQLHPSKLLVVISSEMENSNAKTILNKTRELNTHQLFRQAWC